jgi:hypothetical protein
MRRRKADELKTLALIAAASGLHREAMDCYLQMTELNNPERMKDKDDFVEDSQAKFKMWKERFQGK